MFAEFKLEHEPLISEGAEWKLGARIGLKAMKQLQFDFCVKMSFKAVKAKPFSNLIGRLSSPGLKLLQYKLFLIIIVIVSITTFLSLSMPAQVRTRACLLKFCRCSVNV